MKFETVGIYLLDDVFAAVAVASLPVVSCCRHAFVSFYSSNPWKKCKVYVSLVYFTLEV